MNKLELARETVKWCGIATGTIGTVINQVGQKALVVGAVDEAWRLIQTKHSSWRWLRTEFTTPIVAVAPPTQARYTAASFGLDRFSNWVHDSTNFRAFTLYTTATGVSDETEISEIDWAVWKQKYGRGSQTANRPTEWAMSPDRSFALGKPPNTAFTLNGEYWKSAQTMTASDDEPEMPADYHMAIVWRAVLLLNEEAESEPGVYSRAENKYTETLGQLERDQLPTISIGGGPLA